jgi:uridylate kinase
MALVVGAGSVFRESQETKKEIKFKEHETLSVGVNGNQ